MQRLCNITHYILRWILMIFISLSNYIGITLSVRLSVQIRVRSITFFFASTLSYQIRWRVSHTFIIRIRHWPLISRSNFLTSLRVRPITSVCFDVSIPYWAQGSISMREFVAFIHVLTFDLKVKSNGFLTWLVFGPHILHIRWCVTYIHNLCMTLSLNIKIIFVSWLDRF